MEQVNTHLPDSHADKLEEIAEVEGQSRSGLVREIVQNWLNEHGHLKNLRMAEVVNNNNENYEDQ